MRRLLLLVCLALMAAGPAWADTRSSGYVIWNLMGDEVYARYMMPREEVKYLIAPTQPSLTTRQVGEYVLGHLAVSRDGKKCAVVDQGEEVGLVNTLAYMPTLLRYEVFFHCPKGALTTLTDTAFNDHVPEHLDFARVQVGTGDFTHHVFTIDRKSLDVPQDPNALSSDSILRYAMLGLFHIRDSADIIVFMLALPLIARKRRDFALAFGTLILGYVTASTFSVLHVAMPRFDWGEVFDGMLGFVAAAASIMFSLPDRRLGIYALGGATLLMAITAYFMHDVSAAAGVFGVALLALAPFLVPGRENSRAVFLAIVPLTFGFLDGFVLPNDLALLDLPASSLVPMLTGFDAGVLAGEMLLPLALVALFYFVRPLRPLAAERGVVPDIAASALIGCGLFWFVTSMFT